MSAYYMELGMFEASEHLTGWGMRNVQTDRER